MAEVHRRVKVLKEKKYRIEEDRCLVLRYRVLPHDPSVYAVLLAARADRSI